MRIDSPSETKFWGKVDIKGDKECWLWTGVKSNPGKYGLYRLSREFTTAHRAAWIQLFGEIPDKLEVAHKCATRLCINPSHLYLSSKLENMREAAYRETYLYPSGINSETLSKLMLHARACNARWKMKNIDLLKISDIDIINMYNIINVHEELQNEFVKPQVLMACGHSESYIVNNSEGTSFCLMCEYSANSSLIRKVNKFIDSWNS